MKHLCYLLLLLAVSACTPKPRHAATSSQLPPIYPDYCDVTIPVNIAPLNFLVRGDSIEAIEVVAGDITLNARGNEAVFDIDEWRHLLASHRDISVTVSVCRAGRWTAYRPFRWHVVADRLDPWVSYRLIEPDYEIWNNLHIMQRCIENFDEEALSDYRHANNQCMNCHTPAAQNPRRSMLYVRGPQGGALLNDNGRLRKLAIKTPDMVSSSVYFGFSPSGRYITFSTNIIIPGFHSKAGKRLEVFDTKSDVYVADLHTRRIVRSPLLCDSLTLETFPTFSPDGKYIYYCAAPLVDLPKDLRQLRYALVRIAFDEHTGTIGNRVDTLYSDRSVCHPRVSPDGRHLLFTVQDYGTFPIWHQESDQRLLDLKTGRIDTLAVVNSDKSDTYHSWSSNSRWFVFASKRDDGLYGKPYFCYVDRQGRAHKPFCLPQRSPTRYDNMLKSFNAPELSKGRIPFNASDVERALQQEAEPFR